MHRRTFLGAVGASGLLAGCLSSPRGDDRGSVEPETREAETDPPPTAGPTPTSGNTPTPTPEQSDVDTAETRLARHGVPATICETSIKADPGIYAVLEPAFAADWSAHDIAPAYRHGTSDGLVDEQTVIALTADGLARAYPLTVLHTHEVVNDRIGGPVLVTFCPLCRSGMVAARRLDGGETSFAVTGQLWMPERVFERASEEAGRTFGVTYSGGEEVSVRHNGNLVMYDAATRSYWSQMLARGICGPHTGTELDIRPSSVTTWSAFRERHPDGEVLLPPPHSGTVEPGETL